jgi:hypothetical protein
VSSFCVCAVDTVTLNATVTSFRFQKKRLAKGLEAWKRQDAPLMSGGGSAENAHVAHVKRSRPCSSDSCRTTVVTSRHRNYCSVITAAI